MRRPPWGVFAITGLALTLGGCVAPMTAPEAQSIARAKLTKYCRGNCGALTPGSIQKIKNRWLVDFEAPTHKFTVIVDDGGNAAVTVWDKSRDAAGQ